MPPGQFSRYLFCQGIKNADDTLYLSERVPFRYVYRKDSTYRVVAEGDTLFTLASEAYQPLSDPSSFFWVIADFQPEPILDPSLKLTPGRTLVIPSRRMLIEEILNENRRDDFSA